MSKVLILYYSTYGHIEQMAEAVAAGVRETGATADIKRVPETVPEEIAKPAHFKLDQQAPVATVAELEQYDAIILGAPTRFGRMSLVRHLDDCRSADVPAKVLRLARPALDLDVAADLAEFERAGSATHTQNQLARLGIAHH